MGMAASQARLLSLTSRLHDIEYQSQHIMSQKIALATQKDELYDEYLNALDAKKIQVRFNQGANTKYQDACFANLFGYNAERMQTHYALIDARSGKMFVDEKTAEAYDNYHNDKYAFAWAMLGFANQDGWQTGSAWNQRDASTNIGIGTENDDIGDGGSDTSGWNRFMSEVEREVYEKYVNEHPDCELEKAYENLVEVCSKEDASTAEKREALNNFRDKLYSTCPNELIDAMCLDKNLLKNDNGVDATNPEYHTDPESVSREELNYWVHMFESIQNCGGYTLIEPGCESGQDGVNWFNTMVTSGRVLIETYDTSKKEWSSTSVATSTSGNHLQEVEVGGIELQKAEAKYQYELDIIKDKDTDFDQDLKELETERTAITTEMDSIKKVKDDNIERTFGIFS